MRPLITLSVAVSSAITSAAWAAPTCVSLDEPEFRALVLDSQSAIDRDDATLHAAILDEVRSRVPCMTFSPSPRLWSDFLVGVAIVEFYREGDWQAPMGAALRIRPTVDRGVGSGHPLSTWVPPESAPAISAPVPPGVRLYVDGELAGELPPAQGLYLVQREEDGYWATVLLLNQPLPDGWLTEPIEVPARLGGWASVSGLLGSGGAMQHAAWSSDFIHEMDYAPNPEPNQPRALLGPAFGLAAHGVLTYGSLGLAGNVSLPWLRAPAQPRSDTPASTDDPKTWEFTRASGATVRLAPVWTNTRIYAGPGIGMTSADVYEGEEHRAIPLPYALGVIGARSVGGRHEDARGMDDKAWDGELTVGAGLATQVLAVRAGARPIAEARNVRLGFDLSGQRGHFLGADDGAVTTGAWRAVLQIGLVWE